MNERRRACFIKHGFKETVSAAYLKNMCKYNLQTGSTYFEQENAEISI